MLSLHYSQQPSTITQLNDQAKFDQAKHREMLLEEVSSLEYLLHQGLVVWGYEELEENLIQLPLLHCEDSPDWWLGLKETRTSQLQF